MGRIKHGRPRVANLTLQEFLRFYPPIMGGDETLTTEGSLLDRLIVRRAELAATIEPLIEARETEEAAFEVRVLDADEAKRPTDEERTAFAEAGRAFSRDNTERMRAIGALDQRIERQELVERGRQIAERASTNDSPSLQITRQPGVYGGLEQQSASYFVDLLMHANPNARSLLGARADGWDERLQKHAKVAREIMPERERRRDRIAEQRIESAEREFRGTFMSKRIRDGGLVSSPFETRAPSRIDGQGGFFIPPFWDIEAYLEYLRPGRIVADLTRSMPLPKGTNTILLPKITVPTMIGIQGADNAPIVTQDIKDSFIHADVKTLAGFADLPLQLIEQSPGAIIDTVVMNDMTRAYDVAFDQQIIAGKGLGAPLSGGEIVGLYPANNWGATQVPWAAASPTGPGFNQLAGAMASKVSYSRFNLDDFAIALHNRRWFWYATAVDTLGRPLVENAGFSPQNASALMAGDSVPFEGYVGRFPFGPKCYIDPNMPTNDAGHNTTGTNDADVALAAIWPDVWTFEGEPRTDVFAEALSGTLEVRYRLYNYIAMLVRYGPSLAIATGTGFAPPVTIDGTFY